MVSCGLTSDTKRLRMCPLLGSRSSQTPVTSTVQPASYREKKPRVILIYASVASFVESDESDADIVMIPRFQRRAVSSKTSYRVKLPTILLAVFWMDRSNGLRRTARFRNVRERRSEPKREIRRDKPGLSQSRSRWVRTLFSFRIHLSSRNVHYRVVSYYLLFTHINKLNVNNTTFKYFMSVILDPPISHQSASTTVTKIVKSSGHISMYLSQRC